MKVSRVSIAAKWIRMVTEMAAEMGRGFDLGVCRDYAKDMLKEIDGAKRRLSTRRKK